MEEKQERYDICGQIIGAAMKVHSTLGPGFLESVYQNALIWELRKSGFRAEAEWPITVRYDGEIVGAFAADVLVNDKVIVELKVGLAIAKLHEVQLVNYLGAIFRSGWKSSGWPRTVTPKNSPRLQTKHARNRFAWLMRPGSTFFGEHSITNRGFFLEKWVCSKSRA